MLVVLPTHNGDRNLTVGLAAHIAHLGGVKNHECLIVCPQQTNLGGIESFLCEAFGKLHVLRYTETLHGWPFGPNEAAAIAMTHCAVNPELKYHYLMLEPDCVPTTRFWLDMIDMDYRRCGKQILGVRIPTIEISTERQVGTHVIGVAVYPNNFAQVCPLVKSLVSMTAGYKNQNAMPMPWDAYFGPYASRMVADTTLIQHLQRVRNVSQDGQVTWDCPSLENALSQVNPQAVLVHGSKHPNFLAALTSPQPQTATQPIQDHASQVRSQEHREKHSGNAQGEELRESSPTPREESREQDGRRSSDERQPGREVVLADSAEKPKEKNYMGWSENAKVQARQMVESEKVRKALGIEFPLNTAEFARARFFHFNMKWPKVRSYAVKLGIQIYKKQKGELINEIVKKEISDGTESWVKELLPAPQPEPTPQVEPLPPVELENAPAPTGFGVSNAVTTAVQWKPVDENGRLVEPPGNTPALSDPRKEQMRQMLASRGLLKAS